jgi:N-acetylglucosamine-6-phosphate deacetylase
VARLGVGAAIVNGELVPGDVEVAGDQIAAVGVPKRGRGLAIPGLVDLQVNGYAGVDFAAASPEEYRLAEAALLADGVTAYLPTITSAHEEDLLAALGRAKEAMLSWHPGGAKPLAVHLEGPFLSAARRGIHPLEVLRDPDMAMVARLFGAAPIALWTLAPELPGALELIRWLRQRGVTVSLGHSDASYTEACAGFEAGASSVTHFFNGMRPLGHRDPGIVAASLLRPRLALGTIADGAHVAPEVVEIVRRVAARRMYLVTDAVAAARAPDGVYHVGPAEIRSVGGLVHGEQGRVGGGTTPLLADIRALVGTGAPLLWAVGAATSSPANVVGRRHLGRLRPGAPADVVIVDDSLQLRRVMAGGLVTVDA